METPPNYSLAFDKLSFLYKGHTAVIRSRLRSRAMEGLIRYLNDFVEEPDGTFQTMSFALVREGKAYLVPRFIENWLDLISSRLHRAGFQFVDHQHARIDLADHTVVVPEVSLEVDREALRSFLPAEDFRREPPPVPGGRYPLEAWSYFGADGEVLSPEHERLRLFQSAANAFQVGVPRLLAELERLQAKVRIVNLNSPYTDSLPDKIISLAQA